MPTTVYLARHATPDRTRADLSYHLPPGPPLTPQGEAEARALGVFLEEAGVTQIYCSPLERCLATARFAAETGELPVEVVESLTEWQPGELLPEVADRLWPTFMDASRLSQRAGPAVLITHGGPVAALLERLGMEVDTIMEHRIYDNQNPLPPAGVWQAHLPGSTGSWELDLVFNPAESDHQSQGLTG
jgi:broad specificity phosphatase PhoE